MKAGDIVFIRGNSFLSKIIKRFDKGDFTHVAIAVSDNEIFEAQYYMKTKINKMHYEDYDIVSLNLSNKDVEKIIIMCNILQGKWYDYTQAISYMFRYWFDSHIKNDPNALICSEVLAILLYMIDKTEYLDTNVTPNELYRQLNKIDISC
jgi:ribosomal protein L21E